MWFGTRNGLNRYDGKKIITFNKEQNGLQGNSIKQIVIGPQNTLIVLYSTDGAYWLESGKMDVLNLSTFEITPIEKYFKHCPFHNCIQTNG